MADIKKEQERAELHRTIWSIADDLRGSVDGWDFKHYVLGMLFYRYISENFTVYINEGEAEAGNAGFDYAKLSDEEAEDAREELVATKGFFIPPSHLFWNVKAKAANDENLNETLETVFNGIENSAKGTATENDMAGLFDDFDVNSNKLGATVAKRNEKLVKLINGVASMNLGNVTQENMDRIVETYASRLEDDHFSHLASYNEIEENDYNLSVSTYVEPEDTREKIDIIELNAQIAEIVKKEDELRKAIDDIIAEIEG